MAVTPDTTIKLLKVPIEIDNLNQLTFASKTAQFNYFNSLPSIEEEELYYQRKDNYISWPAHIDSILGYNYCMYQNSNYSNKWFYAFITRMEYENDGMTRVYIETDTFQTWQFDIQYKASFVEREHTNDDTIGTNLIPENLQLGEYVTNKKYRWLNTYDEGTDLYTGANLVIILGVTADKDGNATSPDKNDGIFSGVTYYAYSNSNSSTEFTELKNLITQYATNGKADAIKCLFLYPASLVTYNATTHLVTGNNIAKYRYINESVTESTVNRVMDLTNSLDNYTPVNNKLRTFPYSFIQVFNNGGSDAIYRYEDFYTISNGEKTLVSNPQFRIQGCITPSGSIRLTPRNYKGVYTNSEEGLNMAKFPVCNWATDVFTNWLTQNGVNIGLSVAGSIVSGVAGAVTGNAIGVASGILGVANTLGEIYKESLTPPQVEGNINCGDVVTASGQNDFHFEVRSIKKEMAKIIDDYFSMYGYKTNALKLPNITGRTNWNYVKTINCNIEGDIPQEDLQKIKDIFNEGVTLWHNPSTFLDYTQSNTII